MSTLETKIANLLAKAESTNHPAEAEAFMAKAEELMLKHGIERAQLQAGPGSKKEEIVTVRITMKNGHGYATAMASIAHRLAPFFSVQTLKSSLPDGGQIIWLIGHKSDVENAERLANSLMAQSRAQALHWWKTEGKLRHPGFSDNDAYLARREFIYGFAQGVRERLEETSRRVTEETGAALVLLDRSKVVENWVNENMDVREGRRSSRRAGSFAGAVAGQAAGRQAVGNKGELS